MNSIGPVLKAHLTRLNKPIPMRFVCPDCASNGGTGGVAEEQREAFLEWAKKELPPPIVRFAHGNGSLCDCFRIKVIRRERELRNTLDSNLPARADKIAPRTFENFNNISGSSEMVTAVQEFIAGDGPPILTLVGLTGCGKSHLMEAAGRVMLTQGLTVRYERTGTLLDRLRHTFDSAEDGNIQDVLDFYVSRTVLLLDDLGMHSLTPWGEGYLTSLVEDRILDGSSTIVTTNHASRDELAAVCGDRLASRLFDRHSGSVRVVVSEAPDYRLGG